MKIRNGFVSNSSSSSFVLIGKPIDFEDIVRSQIKKIRIMSCDQTEMLSEKLYDRLLEKDPSDVNYVFNFYHQINSGWDGTEILIEDQIDLPFVIIGTTVSHHCNWNYLGLDEFMEAVFDGGGWIE